MFRCYPLASYRFGLEIKEAVVQISTHSSSLLSAKGVPLSTVLLLPVDEADEFTGTAKISAFTINIVLEYTNLV